MEKIFKKENAITLIAMIVTIIILLILAVISIAMIKNSNLLDKTKIAKEKYDNSSEYEQQILSDYTNSINTYEITNSNREVASSTRISNFTPIVSVKGNIAKVNVNVQESEKAVIKGYAYLVNNKVQLISSSDIEDINLGFNQTYQLAVIAIDEDFKFKESSEIQIKTESKIYLFDGGKENLEYIGGFNYKFTSWNSWNSASYGSNSTDNWFLLNTCNSGNTGIASTKNKIDFTNINTLTFDAYFFSNHSQLLNNIYLGISDTDYNDSNFIKKVEFLNVNNINRKNFDIDVSDIKGTYYIKWVTYHGTNVADYGIYSCIYNIIAK